MGHGGVLYDGGEPEVEAGGLPVARCLALLGMATCVLAACGFCVINC
jgi:hypothetical protein